jgi:citrate synthase
MFRNFNLFELCDRLKFKGSEEPLPEALIWFLFTGELPSESETNSVIESLHRRSEIPAETQAL